MYFQRAVILAWINAASLCSISLLGGISNKTANMLISYVIGGSFWVTLIVGQVMLWKANAQRRTEEKRRTGAPGIVSFCKTPKGIAADIVLAVSAAVLVLILVKKLTGGMVLLTLAALVLSLQLHCFYNGRNYRFLCREHKEGK